MGHVALVLVFRNTASTDCVLRGYPGVTPYAGAEQGTPAHRTLNGYMGGAARVHDVLLRPGSVASAMVEGSDVPTGSNHGCPDYTKLVVTPPNLHDGTPLHVRLPGCARLTVHPVVDGSHGRDF